MRFTATVVATTAAIISCVAAQDPDSLEGAQRRMERLESAASLRCEFEQGAQALWENGELSLESARWGASSLVDFDSIDRQQQTARLTGSTGRSNTVALLATADTLTFLETPLLGSPNMTTVFAWSPANDSDQFVAVTSRHVAGVLGSTSPFPSQFYGTCRILN